MEVNPTTEASLPVAPKGSSRPTETVVIPALPVSGLNNIFLWSFIVFPEETTATSGPNGGLDWQTCGINDGGWKPPYVGIHDLVTKDLWDSLNSGNSPFEPCRPYIDMFVNYGNQYDIPPIMLASFAMQESTCNPNTVGGGGEQGLMQITQEKCGGAPGGDCKNPVG
jgi:hypothetical protein